MAVQHTTYGHRDLETESTQWANSVKTFIKLNVLYGLNCAGDCLTSQFEVRFLNSQ